MDGHPNFPIYSADNDGINDVQEDDLTASYETIRPLGQQDYSFDDIFKEDYVWSAGGPIQWLWTSTMAKITIDLEIFILVITIAVSSSTLSVNGEKNLPVHS